MHVHMCAVYHIVPQQTFQLCVKCWVVALIISNKIIYTCPQIVYFVLPCTTYKQEINHTVLVPIKNQFLHKMTTLPSL